MARAKETSGSKSRTSAKSGAKGATAGKSSKSTSAKSSDKSSRTTPGSTAADRSKKSKQTNSGGSRRIASEQNESTRSKQAATASKSAGSSSKTKASASSKNSSASKTAGKSSASAGNGKAGKKGNGVSKVLNKVSNFLKGEQNAISLLKADHDVVEKLFEKVKANENGNNSAVFKNIKTELETHTHIEETIFYPFLLEKGKKDVKDIVREGIEEHGQVKTLLTEMDGMSGRTDEFKAKIKVMMENVEHHVKEEENEMFPMVEDQIGSEKLKELGTQMQKEKEKFKKNMAKRSAKSTPTRKRASATA